MIDKWPSQAKKSKRGIFLKYLRVDFQNNNLCFFEILIPQLLTNTLQIYDVVNLEGLINTTTCFSLQNLQPVKK